jgi:hypothetical protein
MLFSLKSRRLLAVMLAVPACLAFAGCTSASPPAVNAAPSQPPASTGSAGQPTGSVPAASPTQALDSVRDLVITPLVRRQLLNGYLSLMGFKPADISGTMPDEVFYAYDPASRTYWAMASFIAAAQAPASVPVDMQDGERTALYTRTVAGLWHVERGGDPGPCYVVPFFPRAVLAAWGLATTIPSVLGCSTTAASPPA